MRPNQAIVNRECRANGQRALAYGRRVRLFIIRHRWWPWEEDRC